MIKTISEIITDLKEKYYGTKMMKRLAVTYFLTFFVPLSILLVLYYQQFVVSVLQQGMAAQEKEVTQICNEANKRIEDIEALGMLFNQNDMFCQYVDGRFLSDSERVYTYMTYIKPQVSYVLRTNQLLKSVQVYALNPDLQVAPYYFTNEWNDDKIPLSQVLETPTLQAQWTIEINENENIEFKCHETLYNDTYSKKIGILSFFVNPKKLWEDLINKSSGTRMVVCIENNQYVVQSNGTFTQVDESLQEQIEWFNSKQSTMQPNGFSTNLIQKKEISSIDAQLYFFTEVELFSTKGIVLLVGTICIVLLLFTSIFFVTFSTGINRIIKLAKHLETTDYNHLKPYLESRHRDEIGVFIHAYNVLAENINNLTHIVYRANIKSREAQFYVLQAQINPHFLINTLENIRMMAVTNQDLQTAQMLLMLGKSFQYTIEQNNIFSTIQKEIEHTTNYLELCKMRWGGKLSYTIGEWSAISTINCPRNIIQPLLENCINHAFKGISVPREIEIDFEVQDENITIRVSDNGKGIEEKRLCQIQEILSGESSADKLVTSGNGIGLQNVNERIKLFYGSEYGVFLYRRHGNGTICEVRVKRMHELAANFPEYTDRRDRHSEEL